MRFPTAASSLSPEVEAKLTEFAQRLIAENKNVYLEIQGHTDSTGSPAENMRLGEQRADAVRRFLHKQGIAESRMSTISYGQKEPAASNSTPDARRSEERPRGKECAST